METPIQIVSREIIKPSSPTPDHLRNMKLSYLDELLSPLLVAFIFFYEANKPNGLACTNLCRVSQRLKQSLSDILTSFYPLAGAIDEDCFHIDCDDSGVEFIVARAQTCLADVIQERNADALNRYRSSDCSKEILLSVKLTFFRCGGISVGISFSHKLADCASIMGFVNAWATTCRGEMGFEKFNFNLSDHFPPRGLSNQYAHSKEENLATKRFLFDKEALLVLKREATSPYVMNPTKVEVVSAFICKHFVEVAKHKSSSSEMVLPISHMVNLRTRMKDSPHSLENVFGNCVMLSNALYNTETVDTSTLYQDLVRKLRGLITKIDMDYVMKAQTGDDYLRDVNLVPSVDVKGELIETCWFSSWCKFSMYEVDYGWGKPTWVCTTELPIKNGIVLMDTKCGKGIEAWICMEKDTHESLYNDIKLISTRCEG